ncbi:uncharacterized protein TNCV_1732601 [Trichonephila clavipes]|nr:uncharacterized protein TNCV_1732601 [Trichonephila clavipes]
MFSVQMKVAFAISFLLMLILSAIPESTAMPHSREVSRWKVHGPFFFGESSVTGSVYLDTLQLWLLPQLKESESDNFIWQQDGAPPDCHLSVRDWLNIALLD